MIRKIGNIEYEFTRKRVKNINLRIRPDGAVCVSAPSYVPAEKVDEFVLSKADFIADAQKRMSKKTSQSDGAERLLASFSELDCDRFFRRYIDAVYPMFKPYGIKYPLLRVKNMKSRWGSCIPSKHVITLSRQLMIMPRECIEYVVVHEFCHFFEANHSKKFYGWVERFLPDWKRRRDLLNKRAAG